MSTIMEPIDTGLAENIEADARIKSYLNSLIYDTNDWLKQRNSQLRYGVK